MADFTSIAPDLVRSRDHDVHFRFVFVAVVPEADGGAGWVGPGGLGDELLNGEEYQEVAHARPLGEPVVGSEAGKRRG